MSPFIVMIPAAEEEGGTNPLIGLGAMDIGYQGQPFIFGSIETIDLTTMDVGNQGQPFIIFVGS